MNPAGMGQEMPVRQQTTGKARSSLTFVTTHHCLNEAGLHRLVHLALETYRQGDEEGEEGTEVWLKDDQSQTPTAPVIIATRLVVEQVADGG